MNKNLIYAVALFSSIISCKIKNLPENFGLRTKPLITAPLLDVDLTLRDVVNSQDIQPTVSVRADSVYVLSYRDTIKDILVSDYVTLKDQSFSQSYQMPNANVNTFNAATSGYNPIFTNSGELDFLVNSDQKLTKIELKSGTLNISVVSSFPENVQAVITFPDVTNNAGNSLASSFTIVKNSGLNNFSVDVAGFEIDLTKGSSTSNKLRYIIEYSVIKPAGSTSKVTASNNKITFTCGLSSLKYSYLEGYLGEINLGNITDSVVVELFKNSINGDITFSEPVVTLGIDNSAGISAGVSIDPLKVKFANRTTNNFITRNGSSSFLDTVISGAVITAPNTKATTNVNWNARNSNVQEVFKPSPFTVGYNASVILNKKSSVPVSTKNFITDQSTIVIRASVDLPMIGTVNNLSIVDTVDLDVNSTAFQNEKDFEKIEYIVFKLNTDNGFPIDAVVQAYLMDSLNVKRDSLITKDNFQILPACNVDADGKTVYPLPHVYYERKFTRQEYLDRIKYTKKLLLVGKFNSKKDGGVPQKIKIYGSDRMKFKLATDVKLNLNVSTKDSL